MNDSLKMFMEQLRFRMNVIENSLQTEESGNKIAFMQGNCAGFRALCAGLNEAGYGDFSDVKKSETTIFEFNEKENTWSVTTGKFDTLLQWNSVALDVEEVMEDARKQLQEKINKKKDWLFYESQKGRDLYWIKGWWCIMSCFDDWCAKIHDAYKIAKKDHDYSLNFDEDDE